MTSMGSRFGGRVVITAAGCMACFAAGCTEPAQRLNAPPQGASDRPHAMQDTYVYMNDNALLAEMSMSPAHFVSNRPDLNALGLRRLMRYADLLKEYGGTVHYDGLEDPEPLARERRERIQSFLAQAGVDPKTFAVESGLAAGRGLRGAEAAAIREFSTFSPEQQGREQKGKAWTESTFSAQK
ncbi:MAG: hypothetical protein HRF43_10165 [Phycisphaerae bacterium]